MLKNIFLSVLILLLPLSRLSAQVSNDWSQKYFNSDSVMQRADMKYPAAWSIASTPAGQPGIFPEGAFRATDMSRLNNAKLVWNSIDPLFYDKSPATPVNILNDPDALSHFSVCPVWENQLFPEAENPCGCPVNLSTLNISFYPEEKGPWNFDLHPGPFSAGIGASGHLNNPDSRWGGITRSISGFDWILITDTAATRNINYKFIDGWLMDPFAEDSLNEGGTLFFNIGDVSEDVIDPGIMNAETGDPGLDNLSDAAERNAYGTYLDSVAALYGTNSPAYMTAVLDPCNDDYHYFRGHDYDQMAYGVLNRYKKFNGTEGNSTGVPQESYPTVARVYPDAEDINHNASLDTAERYYQFRLNLKPWDLVTGHNHITEQRTVTTIFPNGMSASVNWYHFMIPITEPDTVIGGFCQLKSARFMRIFLKGFAMETHLRFATLDLDYLQKRTFKGRISVYPNPTDANLTIDFDNREAHSLALYDISGRIIFSRTISLVDEQKLRLDLSGQAPGIYFLKLITAQETVIEKVIVN